MKILLIDSDQEVVEMLMQWLRSRGYDMYRAYSAEQAKRAWSEQRPDIVIMDTNMRGGNALELCQDLRTVHDALVIVLSNRKDVEYEVYCLESGADDFLRKPFFPGQLLAHLHAVSRRMRSTLETRISSSITVGPFHIDTLQHTVVLHGRTITLTPIESRLLHLLTTHADKVCSYEQIIAHVWGYRSQGDAGLVRSHIRHLRQKIEDDPDQPEYIMTVPNQGYMLVCEAGEREGALPQ